jgi:hypothetical protein
VAVAFTVALGGGTRRATSKQTTPVSGGTLRAGLLFTDAFSHFAKLPPGYD